MKNACTFPTVTFDLLTVNIGETQRFTEIAQPDAALPLLKPLTSPGFHLIGGPSDTRPMFMMHTPVQPGYSIVTLGELFGGPAVTCHLCLNTSLASKVWTESLIYHLEYAHSLPDTVDIVARTMCAKRPYLPQPAGLFMAVHMQPGVFNISAEELRYLTTFEPALYYILWLYYKGLL